MFIVFLSFVFNNFKDQLKDNFGNNKWRVQLLVFNPGCEPLDQNCYSSQPQKCSSLLSSPPLSPRVFPFHRCRFATKTEP